MGDLLRESEEFTRDKDLMLVLTDNTQSVSFIVILFVHGYRN